MRRLFLPGAALLFCAVSPSGAQPHAAPSDSLLRRVLALDTVAAERFRALDSIRRSLARPLPDVTIHAGPIDVRTTRELAPRVRRAAESVAALVAAAGDTAIAARAAGHTAVVMPDSARSLFGVSPVLVLRADTGRALTIARSRAPITAPASQIAAHLTTFVEQFALQAADSTLSAWVMVGRVPLRQPTDAELADAYIELATVGSTAARRCRLGDVASCLDVLGIDSMPGSRLERWYAESDYRAMLAGAVPAGGDSAAVATWLRCRQAADQAACITAARALPARQVPLPLSASARFVLLRTVLDAGGPGAYDRLLSSSGTLDARLAGAAGQPIDAIAARWLARIERSRPERMRVTPALALASLGWCGALIGVALVRRGSWT